MARDGSMRRKKRRSASEQYKDRKSALPDLEALAILLLADAQTDYEELVALSVAQIVMQEAHDLKGMNGGRYGTRGSYDRKKSKDFFNLLMYEFSDRWFKAWMR